MCFNYIFPWSNKNEIALSGMTKMSCIPNTRCPKWKCIFMYFLCIQKETVHNSSSTENIVRLCLRSCFSRSESTQDKEPTKAATVFQMTISLWVPPLYRESSLENPLLWLKRIKELKKLRQRLAYSSFGCKSSWILITSLDLFFFIVLII